MSEGCVLGEHGLMEMLKIHIVQLHIFVVIKTTGLGQDRTSDCLSMYSDFLEDMACAESWKIGRQKWKLYVQYDAILCIVKRQERDTQK